MASKVRVGRAERQGGLGFPHLPQPPFSASTSVVSLALDFPHPPPTCSVALLTHFCFLFLCPWGNVWLLGMGETTGSLSLPLLLLPPFLPVLRHPQWSQIRPVSASASCREPSLPWWWLWPSGDLSPRLWGWLTGRVELLSGVNCPWAQALGKRKIAWKVKCLRQGGCLPLSPLLGLKRPSVASPGSPGPGAKDHWVCPRAGTGQWLQL
jgi:hypothetical protein